MIARAAVLALLAALAGPRPAAASQADGVGGRSPTASAARASNAAAQPPLVITMPDTQPVLPSGMIELDPSRTPGTGDANALEPNIDGGRSGTR